MDDMCDICCEHLAVAVDWFDGTHYCGTCLVTANGGAR